MRIFAGTVLGQKTQVYKPDGKLARLVRAIDTEASTVEIYRGHPTLRARIWNEDGTRGPMVPRLIPRDNPCVGECAFETDFVSGQGWTYSIDGGPRIKLG